MKDLIIKSLDSIIEKFEKRVPLTKTEMVQVDIQDVSPLNLVSFMKKNNIPDNAWFSGHDNGYDGYDRICLGYNIEVPTTEKDRDYFRNKYFTSPAFKSVFDTLVAVGYKRVGFNSRLLDAFNDTTVYKMYINKDFDRLVSYFSLHFKKEST